MENRLFLLSVKELGEEPSESELWQQVYERLDEGRLTKVTSLRNSRKRAESAGGGLLVQHLLHQVFCEENEQRERFVSEAGKPVAFALERYTLSELLSKPGVPIPVRYTYGTKGKPYLQARENLPEMFFNLSHSGDYVICAVSEREVGADIQKMQMQGTERLANRFFSEEERKLLQSCDSSEHRLEIFYRLWTRKEAYGKLTGEGITASIDKDFSDLTADWMRSLIWEEFDELSGYKIACCARRQDNGM
ncbi:MAG: 4'-phosphopantetheinyl transferase superfamily protein [Acetatifactor sp.]|nr:4'-phosphopantetheinyl transferase superfamily protein [Acetatifactor sp.]